jgi:3-oxoacyl-[acyl-carrier-protein] synthase III
MPNAVIRAIRYHLPERTVTTADLAAEFPSWPVEKIESITGIACRHIADDDECASDLAVQAAQKLFASGICSPQDIDYILFCTQTPDHFLPTTACLIQERLGIPKTAGALDFNMACSGYIYGLGLAQGLIASGQATSVLLLTGETYSKFLHREDRSVRTLFGDAAAATWLTASDTQELWPFVYGTDGSGGPNLIVPAGAMRRPRSAETAIASEDDQGNKRSPENLYLGGPESFNFTMSIVPDTAQRLFAETGFSDADIDLYVFHQANEYMLNHLRKRLKIPAEKFPLYLRECGNTVSSTIPIALYHAATDGRLQPGMRVMMMGFGAGYSWGGTILRFHAELL